MPLDRSDQSRTWVPLHTGSKNRVRLNWSPKTTARRVETLNGVPINPRTGEIDVEAALLAGLPTDVIITALEES